MVDNVENASNICCDSNDNTESREDFDRGINPVGSQQVDSPTEGRVKSRHSHGLRPPVPVKRNRSNPETKRTSVETEPNTFLGTVTDLKIDRDDMLTNQIASSCNLYDAGIVTDEGAKEFGDRNECVVTHNEIPTALKAVLHHSDDIAFRHKDIDVVNQNEVALEEPGGASEVITHIISEPLVQISDPIGVNEHTPYETTPHHDMERLTPRIENISDQNEEAVHQMEASETIEIESPTDQIASPRSRASQDETNIHEETSASNFQPDDSDADAVSLDSTSIVFSENDSESTLNQNYSVLSVGDITGMSDLSIPPDLDSSVNGSQVNETSGDSELETNDAQGTSGNEAYIASEIWGTSGSEAGTTEARGTSGNEANIASEIQGTSGSEAGTTEAHGTSGNDSNETCIASEIQETSRSETGTIEARGTSEIEAYIASEIQEISGSVVGTSESQGTREVENQPLDVPVELTEGRNIQTLDGQSNVENEVEQISGSQSDVEQVGQERQTSVGLSDVENVGQEREVSVVANRAILRGRSVRIVEPDISRRTRLPSVQQTSEQVEAPVIRSEVNEAHLVEDHLPRGWEARIDGHGRIFYIDHINHLTTWKRPQAPMTVRRQPTISAEDRRNMDRRYQSMRRSIRPNVRVAARTDDPSSTGVSDESSSVGESNNTPNRSNQISGSTRLPGAKFLTRPDFYALIQNNARALAEYNRQSSLKHLVNKIRRDGSAYERYHHHRDLVVFVNLFSDPSKPLPTGWEMKLDKSSRPFFISHSLKITTYVDPRLPPELQMHSDVLRHSDRTTISSDDLPTAYNDKVVMYLRQPNILDILKERHPQVISSIALKNKINLIRSEGVDALNRFSNDIELTMLLSVFENEIMSYAPSSSRDSLEGSSSDVQKSNSRVPASRRKNFEAKLCEFYSKLEYKGYRQGPTKYRLIIRRDHILEDAFTKIMSLSKKELQRSKLAISFEGEEGFVDESGGNPPAGCEDSLLSEHGTFELDYGGPSREFFFLLSRELFNPYYGLFEYSANDTYTIQISPASMFVENAHEWFRFAGRVIALALVHQYLLDVFFTRPFYKILLHLPPSLSDLESLDAEFHKSLEWIKDGSSEDLSALDLTFSVDEEIMGKVTERELKTNGKNIAVNEKNKKEYIERMIRWRVERGVSKQIDILVQGFNEILDPRLVSKFDAQELELVIAGAVEVNVADWRRNTEYRSGFHDKHPVIIWFWTVVEQYNNDQRLRLLQFVTGTSSIPFEGFSALRGSNGPRRFCIEKWGKVTDLPRAHTCFNRLDLPPYISFETLLEKLTIAVEETGSFGLE